MALEATPIPHYILPSAPPALKPGLVYLAGRQVYLERNGGVSASQRCPASTFEVMMTTTVRSNSPFLSTFPGRYYFDPAIFHEEQELIFGKMWFYIGRADALSSPGSYRVVTCASESIILTRDKEGQLHAFCHLCRHRAARLCNQQR